MLIQNEAEILTQQRRFNDQNQIHTIVAVSVTVQYANSKTKQKLKKNNQKIIFSKNYFLQWRMPLRRTAAKVI